MNALLKDAECSNADEIRELAKSLTTDRCQFHSSNPQDIEKYRQYIPKCIKLAVAIPWSSQKCMKMTKPGFQWGYSRDCKYTLSPETSIMIDAMGCIYNCIVIQCNKAACTDDLKARAQELSKATYYCKLAVKVSQDYASLLQNVDSHFGQGYFTTIELLTEAQCIET